MDGKALAELVKLDRKHLYNVVTQFKEEHGVFAPAPGMYTTTQQLRHIGQTITWFREGAWGAGFDMDFAAHDRKAREPMSFSDAKQELDDTFEQMIAFLSGLSAAEAHAPMADNPIMGTAPRSRVLGGMTDHTAHHRGILTVYLRLLGITPNMVYMD